MSELYSIGERLAKVGLVLMIISLVFTHVRGIARSEAGAAVNNHELCHPDHRTDIEVNDGY